MPPISVRFYRFPWFSVKEKNRMNQMNKPGSIAANIWFPWFLVKGKNQTNQENQPCSIAANIWFPWFW